MYLIAHRGDSDFFKDNSLPGFLSAIEKKFDMIELDIQLTLDNNVIIYHDTFINDKLVKKMNLNEILAIDSDIITLNEFFDKIDLNKIGVYLDIKGCEYVCIYIHKIIKNIGKKDRILIGSFNTLILEKMYNLDHEYNLGLITENALDDIVLNYYIRKLNIAFVSFHWSILNHQSIQYLHSRNVLSFTYTCKNDNIKSFMKEYDLDGIVSNYKF